MSQSSTSRDLEAKPLLSSHTVNVPSLRERFTSVCCLPRCNNCLPTKPIVLILVWTVIVSELYSLLQGFVGVVITNYVPTTVNHFVNAISSPLGLVYAILAVISMLYPLSGFLADVYCGRFKTIIIGLTTISISSVTLAAVFVGWTVTISVHPPLLVDLPTNKVVPFYVVGSGAGLLIVIGYAAYRANFIQLGLDQLLEAPSISLSLFIHWAIWADTLGTALVGISFVVTGCPKVSVKVKTALYAVQGFILLCFPLLMILTCWKRHRIYTESGKHNPYRIVIKVAKFIMKHKYPLQRSAFTYCDDERPSRFDYAKERYGGPFTTEQVEDVKTFVRILTLLATLGPVFVMEIQSSVIGFAIFGLHTGYSEDYNHRCTTVWAFLESGALRYVVGSIFLPVYIYFLAKRGLKIFTRLYIGLLLYMFGTLSMLAIDLAGHLHSVNDQGTGSYCMFTLTTDNNTHTFTYPVLEMPWAVLILPNILLGIGPQIVTATIFEFISAQSPHSMKGLLIGVFFAIKGIFQLISSMMLFPFSADSIWARAHISKSSPVINCGFSYLLFTFVVALIGIVLFSIAVKRYKYRERDDKPYDQSVVEEIFYRRTLMRPATQNYDEIYN